MFNPAPTEPVIPMVTAFGPWGPQDGQLSTLSQPTSSTFEGSNVAVYVPVFVPVTCTAKRVWWGNGSTTSGGANVSVAIYSSTADGQPGSKIVECAATTQGTASQIQFVDITDTTIAPGTYWLALAASTSTSTTFLAQDAGSYSWDASLRFQQTSITVGALPASATPAESTGALIYFFGFATTASP